MTRHDDTSVLIDGTVFSVDALHGEVKRLRHSYMNAVDKTAIRVDYLKAIESFTEAKKLTGYCPNCKKVRDVISTAATRVMGYVSSN